MPKRCRWFGLRISGGFRRHAVFAGCLLSVHLHAEELPGEVWPAAWFSAPQTASEVGLDHFQQSPLLAACVKQGTLPPLRERLPQDPAVIVPTHTTGRYGGTLRTFYVDEPRIISREPPLIMDPLVRDVLPNVAKGWESSPDARTLTLFLRRGVKWSDGHPFTSEDFLFWYEYIRGNPELTPVMRPRDVDLVMDAPDPYTVKFTFKEPHPFFITELAQLGELLYTPAHFMRNYHVAFRDREELIAEAKAEGFISWMAYFTAVHDDGMPEPVGLPSLRAFILTRRSPMLKVYERNPFYAKVDPAGNQLPYIDRIQVLNVGDAEVMAAKASTGQVDFAGFGLRTEDIPLFKHGEKAGGYRTLIWNRLYGSDVVIQPNLNYPEPGLREIMNDVRFRRALSVAINRDEINTVAYFGKATPRQTTVIPTSRFYEPEFATAYTTYDPDAARQLLDEMRLVDRDGDGYREYPGGEPLTITVEWLDIETPKGITMELVVEYWRLVGLNVRLKQVTRGLQGARARGNQMQMTLWHADRTSDILFPTEPYWFVPMHSGWEECHWGQWADWYISNGERGEKPSPKAQQLLNWWLEMTTCGDAERQIELGKNILRSQAENLWTIGTVGLAPQPVVVGNRLHNVPKHGYWGWDCRWMLPCHPEIYFMEE